MATAVADSQPTALAPRSFRVVDRVQETADTWTLTLDPAAGGPPTIAPGQFVMVYAFGVGEVPISVSRTPAGDVGLALTVRNVGAVSAAICRSEPGEILGIRGPFGNTWPVAEWNGDVVVVAGGIGLAPLRPVVHAALAREGSGVVVLYGARTPGDLLYTNEVDRWRSHAHVDVTVDAAGGDWRGRVGVVPKLVGTAPIRGDRSAAFVCGPEIMMGFAADALLARGIPAERIHVSLERHMDCGVGLCGHCQLGPTLICRDGPVYRWPDVEPLLEVRRL